MIDEKLLREWEDVCKLAAKIAGIREVCLKCGYTWSSWEESHDHPD